MAPLFIAQRSLNPRKGIRMCYKASHGLLG